MLEGFVTGLLNKYLAQFIDDLDAKQLKLSVFGGEVNLKNLSIKSSCFDLLALPITVRFGRVGRLYLKANWRKLTSEPVKMALSDVFIVVRNKTAAECQHVDFKADLESKLSEKLRELAEKESVWLNEETGEGGGGSARGMKEEQESAEIGLAQKIADNVQVTITNIHVRYETVVRGKPVALGIALKELGLHTTDSAWQKAFIYGQAKSFKLGRMDGLFLYVNTEGPFAQPVANVDAMGDVFAHTVDPEQFAQYQNLLEPVACDMKVTADKRTFPVNCDVTIDKLAIVVSRAQYHGLLDISSGFSELSMLIEERLLVLGRKHSETLDAQEPSTAERKRYVHLYKRTLNAMWLQELDQKEREEYEKMNTRFESGQLKFFRLAAIAELRNEHAGKKKICRREDDESLKKRSGFFGNLFSSKKKESVMVAQVSLSEAEQDEIYEEISKIKAERQHSLVRTSTSGSVSEIHFRPENDPWFEKIHVHLSVERIGLQLLTEDRKLVLKLEGERAAVRYIVYPDSMKVDAALKSIVLDEYFTPNTQFQRVLQRLPRPRNIDRLVNQRGAVEAKLLDQTFSQDLVRFVLHKTPPRVMGAVSAPADSSVVVKLNTSVITLHAEWLDALFAWVDPPTHVDLHRLKTWGDSMVQDAKSASSAKVVNAFENYSSLDLTVELDAPTIVVPQNPREKHTRALVCDLGTLALKTSLHPEDAFDELQLLMATEGLGPDEKAQIAKFYDWMQLELDNMQLFLVNCDEYRTESGSTSKTSQFVSAGEGIMMQLQGLLAMERDKKGRCEGVPYILEPFRSSVHVGRSIVPEVTWLNTVLIDGESQALATFLSPEILHDTLAVAAQFIKPAHTNAADVPTPTLPARQQQLSGDILTTAITSDPPESPDEIHDTEELLALPVLIEKFFNGNENRARAFMMRVDLDEDGTLDMDELKAYLEKKKKEDNDKQVLKISFKLQEATVSFSPLYATDHSTEPAVMLVVSQVHFVHSNKPFVQQSDLAVRDIALYDYEHPVQARNRLALTHYHAPSGAEGGVSEKSVSVRVVTKTLDALECGGKDALTDIHLEMGAVEVVLNPSRLLVLGKFGLSFANAANKALEQVEEAKTESTAGEHDEGDQDSDDDSEAPVSGIGLLGSTFAIRYHGSFGGLVLGLDVGAQRLAEFSIKALEVALTKRVDTAMRADVTLGSVEIQDLSPAGQLHKMVLTHPDGHDAAAGACIALSYSTFVEEMDDYPGYGAAFTGSMRGVKFTYLHRFMEELIHFGSTGDMVLLMEQFDPQTIGDMKENIYDRTSELSSDIMSNLMGAQGTDEEAKTVAAELAKGELASFLKLDFVVSDIDVRIPLSSSSREFFSSKLHEIRVSNSVCIDAEASAEYQQYQVVLSAFTVGCMFYPRFDDDALSESSSLVKTDLCTISNTTVTANLLKFKAEVEVAIVASSLDISLSHTELSMLMLLTNGNLQERAAIMGVPTVIGEDVRAMESSSFVNQGLSGAVESKGGASPTPEVTPHAQEREAVSLVFEMKSFSTTLYSGDGLDKDAQGLVTFACDNFDTELKLSADGAIDVDSKLGKTSVMDVSPDDSLLSVYRTMLQFDYGCAEQQEDAQTSVRMHIQHRTDLAAEKTTTDVALDFNSLHFTLTPVLAKLAAFASVAGDREDAGGNVEDADVDAAAAAVAQAKGTKHKDTHSTETRVVVKSGDLVLHLYDRPLQWTSNSIELRLGVDVEVDISNDAVTGKRFLTTRGGISQLSVYHMTVEHDQKTASVLSRNVFHRSHVLKPVDGHVLYRDAGGNQASIVTTTLQHKRETYPRDRSVVSLELGDITVTFGIKTYRTLMRCVRALTTHKAKDVGSNSSSSSSKASNSAPVLSSFFSDQHVFVRVGKSSIFFANDEVMPGSMIPVFKIRMPVLNFELSQFACLSFMRANVSFDLLYFDSDVREWHLLLESCAFEALMYTNIDESSMKAYKRVMIQDKYGGLDFNVTTSMVDAVRDIVWWLQQAKLDQDGLLLEEKKESDRTEKNDSANDVVDYNVHRVPYRVRNDTDCVLRVRHQEQDTSLPPYSEQLLSFIDEAPKHSETDGVFEDHTNRRYIAVVSCLHPETKQVTFEHGLSLLGSDCVSKPFKGRKGKTHNDKHPSPISMVIDTSIVEGVKTIHVHGNSALLNRTNQALHFRLFAGPSQYGDTHTVQAHSTFYMPVLLFDEKSFGECSVCVKMPGSSNYSNVLEFRKLFTQKMLFVQCRNDETSKNSTMCAHGETETTGMHSIKVCPCISVENLLPCAVELQQPSLEDAPTILPCGQQTQLFCYDVDSGAVKVSLRLDNGFHTERPEHLRLRSNGSAHDTKVPLVRGRHEVLYVQLELSRVNRVTMNVVIYAPYWIMDLTKIPGLVARDDNNKKRVSVAAGSRAEGKRGDASMAEAAIYNGKSDEIRLELADGSKSSCIKSIDLAGTTAWSSLIRNKQRGEKVALRFDIGVQVSVLSINHPRTKLITLAPRFFFNNNTQYSFAVCELQAPSMLKQMEMGAAQTQCKPQSSTPFHLAFNEKRNDVVSLKLMDLPEHSACGYFKLSSIGTFALNFRNTHGGYNLYIKVVVAIQGPSVHLTLSEYKDDTIDWELPFKIVNQCDDFIVRYYQEPGRKQNTTNAVFSDVLMPNTQASFAFPKPMEAKRLTFTLLASVDNAGTAMMELDKPVMCKMDEEGPVALMEVSGGGTVFVYVENVASYNRVVITPVRPFQFEETQERKTPKLSGFKGRTKSHTKSNSNSKFNRISRKLVRSQARLTSTRAQVIDRANQALRLVSESTPTVDSSLSAQPNDVLQAQVRLSMLSTPTLDVIAGLETITYGPGAAVCVLESTMTTWAASVDMATRTCEGGKLTANVASDQRCLLFISSELLAHDQIKCSIKWRSFVGSDADDFLLWQGQFGFGELAQADDGVAVSIVVMNPINTPATSHLEAFSLQARLTSDMRTQSEEWAIEQLQMRLSGVSLSCFNNQLKEVIHLSLHGVVLEKNVAQSEVTTAFTLGKLQLDNQLPNSLYPVILAPTPVPAATDKVPMLQVCVTQSNVPGLPANLFIFRYASMLVQALDLNVEEALIHQLSSYVGAILSRREHHAMQHSEHYAGVLAGPPFVSLRARSYASVWAYQDPLRAKEDSESELGHPKEALYAFFSVLHLQPLVLRFAFNPSPELRTGGGPLQLGVNMGMSLFGNIDKGQLAFNALFVENAAGDVNALAQLIASHYKKEGFKQIYRLLGHSSFLGNPVGLFDNIGTGVTDFFYLPAQGLVKSPKDFGEGLGMGTASIIKNTMSVFSSVGGITNSVTKGISVLSADDEYIASRKRREQKQKSKNTNVATGLFGGLKSFGKGVVGGVTGLVTAPVRGAERDGVGGFFKGMGQGLLGVVVKPTVGVLDLATQTLEGVGNTPESILNAALGDTHKTTPNKPIRAPKSIKRHNFAHATHGYSRMH